jgi:hypothetical protein
VKSGEDADQNAAPAAQHDTSTNLSALCEIHTIVNAETAAS